MSQAVGVIGNVVQLGLDSILIRPKRALGPMAMQVTVEEHHQDDLEITDHPIEQGAQISDHAFKRPAEVVIRAAWSVSPSNSGLIDGIIGGVKATILYPASPAFGPVPPKYAQTFGQAPKTMAEIYAQLLKLQRDVVPFDIYTGKRKYSNMLIRSLSVTTDKTTENSLVATITCREILIASTSIISTSVDVTRQKFPEQTASPSATGIKSLQPGGGFSGAGAGRGVVNPPAAFP